MALNNPNTLAVSAPPPPDRTISYQADSTTLPTAAEKDDLLLVTSDGTRAGEVLEQWIFDGVAWVKTFDSDHGSLTGLLDDDHPQYLNTDRADQIYLRETFETVNKNLVAAGAVIAKTGGRISSMTYANGIVKTFNRDSAGAITSVVLSGPTPNGIDLTKTFVRDASGITSFDYS